MILLNRRRCLEKNTCRRIEGLGSALSAGIPKSFEWEVVWNRHFSVSLFRGSIMVIPKPLWKGQELFCLDFVHFGKFYMVVKVVVKGSLILRFAYIKQCHNFRHGYQDIGPQNNWNVRLGQRHSMTNVERPPLPSSKPVRRTFLYALSTRHPKILIKNTTYSMSYEWFGCLIKVMFASI